MWALLVVDSDDAAATALREGLEQRGYRVTLAHDAPTALLAARTSPHDIAVIAHALPVVDGTELARRLAAVGMTRFVAMAEDGAIVDRDVFHCVVKKPVDLDELDHCLRDFAPQRKQA